MSMKFSGAYVSYLPYNVTDGPRSQGKQMKTVSLVAIIFYLP
jgi:hypothetical protein